MMDDEEKSFIPDITATKNGGKYYFEIANRNEAERDVVGKWKLMSTLARMKNGDFRIFVPYGSMKYTNEILEKKNIEAEVIKLAK
jgi:precorrin-4 methylase